jgi:hypothetical protein
MLWIFAPLDRPAKLDIQILDQFEVIFTVVMAR